MRSRDDLGTLFDFTIELERALVDGDERGFRHDLRAYLRRSQMLDVGSNTHARLPVLEGSGDRHARRFLHQRQDRRRAEYRHVARPERDRRVVLAHDAARTTARSRLQFHGYYETMDGPSGVMALVLAETAVGGLFVLWVTPTWGVLRVGFFKLTGAVLATCAALAYLATRKSLGAGHASGARGLAFWLLVAFASLSILFEANLWFGRPRWARFEGIIAVPVGVAALIALAFLPEAAHASWIGIVQLLVGALFLGAVVDGLLLGHWYLVDKRASREPLKRMAVLLLAGSIVAIVASILGGGGGGSTNPNYSPLLGAGTLTVALAVGLAALCVMIAFFIRAMVKEDSIQAATGFFYLAVIMALAAEFASKVRFY